MSNFEYTPKTVAIIKRHARTMTLETIANVMICSIGTIEAICKKHGIIARDVDTIAAEPQENNVSRGRLIKRVEVEIDISALTIIQYESRRRGMKVRELIPRLIEQIAKDGLFSAVLDK